MNLKLSILAVAVTVALGSCSKQQDPISSAATSSKSADFTLQANGRLLFPSNNAFNQTYEKVSKMSESQLESWLKEVGFHSLQEQRQPTHKNAFAAQLDKDFGFPSAYSALISGAGEYQIGDRISWFHEGFRYIAHSEDELAAIKANPTVATEKFVAGPILVNPSVTSTSGTSQKVRISINPGALANSTGRNSQSTNGDGKYGNYRFNLNRNDGRGDDAGSQRQLGFEAVLYYEDATDRVQPAISGQRTFYTAIYINEYYEYYSRGGGRWYRCDDYPRLTSYSLSSSGTASGTGYYPLNNGSWGTNGSNLSVNSNISRNNEQHSGDDYKTTVLGGYLSSYEGPGRGLFNWNFDITGSYSTRVSIDPFHVHTEGYYLW
jgi:hypothetical protein